MDSKNRSKNQAKPDISKSDSPKEVTIRHWKKWVDGGDQKVKGQNFIWSMKEEKVKEEKVKEGISKKKDSIHGQPSLIGQPSTIGYAGDADAPNVFKDFFS
jgi:hypothetical protein